MYNKHFSNQNKFEILAQLFQPLCSLPFHIGCYFKDFSLRILVYYLRLWLKLQHFFEALCSHGQVHPFGTFESNFRTNLLAGSIFFHLFIINSSSKFIWVVVHYCIVHIFPRRSIILWTKRGPGSRTHASCYLCSENCRCGYTSKCLESNFIQSKV